MGSLIIILLVVLIAALCVRSILKERKSGALCECPGDCAHCKIQCRSSEKYYGKQK